MAAALRPLPPTTKPILCYVTDRRTLALPPGQSSERALIEAAVRAGQAGVDWIQLREKDLAGGALLRVAEAIRRECPRTILLVNDRLDVALASGAAGVHLGEEGLPIAAVREWCAIHAPAGFRIGRSCHSVEGARAAERDGANHLFFGPVFSTPSKLGYGAPQGVARLAEVCGAVSVPVLAIGGVTPENARLCIAAGAGGLAAIRWFQDAGDVSARVAELRAACL